MKLIKTKLLLKYNHNSDVSIATATHLDFCKYQFRCLRPQWSYNEYMNIIAMFIESSFALLSIPFLVLTHGLILYPLWIVVHIVKVKRIVKRLGVERINKLAEEVVKDVSEEEE